MKRNLVFSTLLLMVATSLCAKTYEVSSPNGKLTAVVTDDSGLQLSIRRGSTLLMSPSAIGMNNTNRVLKSKETALSEHIDAPFYRQKEFDVKGRQMDLRLNDGFGLQVRAYDEGVAYRFYTTRKGETVVEQETAAYRFTADTKAWLSYSTNDKEPFAMAFQNFYDETAISKAKDKYAFLPVTVSVGDVKVTLLESDLRSYPGMFVKAGGDKLTAAFAPYPKKMDYYKWRGMSHVVETESYIAKSKGQRTYPWRVFAVTEKDTDMPVNNLVYALATPNQIGDTSWLHPGKVAWDWWNDWNLKGVDFIAGINTQTYKYYIDFAAKNHIPYIVLDEGWYLSAKGDIMNPIAEVNLEELIAYGKQKNVDIVLWTVFNVLDEHLKEACEKYSAMGIKGFKVDFLDRNDQTAVEMAERLAQVCAQYHMMLDYHGFYAPTGMSRTYPNIMNYEGVFGMEECRWAKKETDMPLYDVTFPYIRLMAGQVDFTPGAMRNGTKKNWVECYENPVSMGTRCHQLACYVVHDSPFTMLSDAPTNYEREQPCVDMITSIPDVFDRTVIPQGEMGKYIVTARTAGGNWYAGGQTNWDERDILLSFDFLPAGKSYQCTLFCDGINAGHNAEDYQVKTLTINKETTLPIHMASGGGFLMKLIEK